MPSFIEFTSSAGKKRIEKTRVLVRPECVVQLTSSPGLEMMSTTLWFMSGMEQEVDGNINSVAARLQQPS